MIERVRKVLFVCSRNRLRSKFRSRLRRDQRVICLDIPDDYDYMQPELVKLLKDKAGRYLG